MRSKCVGVGCCVSCVMCVVCVVCLLWCVVYDVVCCGVVMFECAGSQTGDNCNTKTGG